MLFAQFQSILSVITGLVLLCVTSHFVNSKPSPGLELSSLLRRDIKPTRCKPPFLKNGNVRFRQRKKIIKFECGPGYQLRGSSYAGCFNGKWDAPIPVCAKRGCNKLNPPPHGFLLDEDNGLLVYLLCKDDYEVVGIRSAHCDGKKWDRELGTCREKSTKPQTWCDFETESLCGWTSNVMADGFEWKRHLAHQATWIHNGPQFDHTFNESSKGHYMLLETNNGFEDEWARLISPLYSPNESMNACFSMSYFMSGAAQGTLRIYVKPLSVDMDTILENPKYMFFNISGNQRNLWHNITVDIDQYDESFQVIIEGTPGNGHLFDVAVDDVAIFQGTHCAIEEEKIKQEKNKNETEERGNVFDYRSCKSRCSETSPSSVPDETRPDGSIIKACDCHVDCEETCCPDYRSICAFAVSAETDLFIYNSDTIEETTLPIRLPFAKTGTQSFATSTMVPQTNDRAKFTIKPSTTRPITTSNNNVSSRINTKATTEFSLVPSTKQSKRLTNLFIVGTTSSIVTRMTETGHTEFLVSSFSNSHKMNSVSQLPTNMMKDDPTANTLEIYSPDDGISIEEGSGTTPLPLFIILSSIFTICLLLAGASIAIKHYRRKYGPENYKINAETANRNGRIPGEFSDVMYLANEEQIDFTMQTVQT